jgi:peptidoglycan/xylan/chitin deacetylase (PgdA/CDA1 family)
MLARGAFALTVFLALLVVACGDDDDGPSASSTATGSLTARPSETATATPSSAATVTPTPGEVTYVVQEGDTLFSIALQFGTTAEAIAEANGIVDPTQLQIGQVLIIPGGGGTPAPATSAPATETPPAGGAAQVIRYGDTSSKTVAFTFDAGSDAGYTAMILDVLKANGLKVSFGMTGKWAETYPDLLQRIVDEGHTLINHSYDHKSFTGNSTGTPPLTQAERWEQLDRTEEIVQELTGATTKPYFRPPYGDYDDSVNADVGARGYEYNVMWAVDSRGWTGIPAGEITARCLQLAEPGAIYVFHVGAASQDGPALQSIIDGLRASGYEITDLPGVLE